MKQMKQVNPPKPSNSIQGSIDPLSIRRGLPIPKSGAGIHGGKGREAQKQRQDIRNRQDEVAPPGWEGTVKAMKKHKEIDNPWALAWSMKKKGYKSHKPEHKKAKSKKHENIVGFPTFSEWLSARCH